MDALFSLPTDAIAVTADDCYTPRWVTRSEDCPEAPAQAHPRVIPPGSTAP